CSGSSVWAAAPAASPAATALTKDAATSCSDGPELHAARGTSSRAASPAKIRVETMPASMPNTPRRSTREHVPVTSTPGRGRGPVVAGAWSEQDGGEGADAAEPDLLVGQPGGDVVVVDVQARRAAEAADQAVGDRGGARRAQ